MTEQLKNKIIQKLKATGKDVTAVIECLNNNDDRCAAIEADKLKTVNYIGIKYESKLELLPK